MMHYVIVLCYSCSIVAIQCKNLMLNINFLILLQSRKNDKVHLPQHRALSMKVS